MRDKQKAEAIARMRMLDIFPETIKQFDCDGKVSISESLARAFYWAEGWDLDRIEQFEEDHNALVYLVIRSYTTYGKMDSYLYVSQYEEEWTQDRADWPAFGKRRLSKWNGLSGASGNRMEWST